MGEYVYWQKEGREGRAESWLKGWMDRQKYIWADGWRKKGRREGGKVEE